MQNKISYKGNNLLEFFQTSTVFCHLTHEQISCLPLDSDPIPYKRGAFIYEEGSRINGFFVVCKGIVKIFKTGTDGKDQIIRFAKSGDVIGFRSTVTGERACTSTKIIEDAEVVFIHGDMVKTLVKTNGDFAIDLLQLACSELREANDYITDIAQKTVRERLAEVLIQLKNSFKLDSEQFLQITLTREELANIVGTTTESVIRLLSEFKHDELVALQGRRIKILNADELLYISNMSK